MLSGCGPPRRQQAKAVQDPEEGPAWLRSNIRVKIVSKHVAGGSLYLKKGEVIDVLGPRRCAQQQLAQDTCGLCGHESTFYQKVPKPFV